MFYIIITFFITAIREHYCLSIWSNNFHIFIIKRDIPIFISQRVTILIF